MAMATVDAPVHLACAYTRAGRSLARMQQRQSLPFPQNNAKQMLLARRYRKQGSVGERLRYSIGLAKFLSMGGTGLMVAGLYRGVAWALMLLPSVAFCSWRLVTSIFKFWIGVHRGRPWYLRKRFWEPVESLSTLQQCSHNLYRRAEQQHLKIFVSSETSVGYWCGPDSEDGWGFVAGHFSRA